MIKKRGKGHANDTKSQGHRASKELSDVNGFAHQALAFKVKAR
jgi:hypothetical protein